MTKTNHEILSNTSNHIHQRVRHILDVYGPQKICDLTKFSYENLEKLHQQLQNNEHIEQITKYFRHIYRLTNSELKSDEVSIKKQKLKKYLKEHETTDLVQRYAVTYNKLYAFKKRLVHDENVHPTTIYRYYDIFKKEIEKGENN